MFTARILPVLDIRNGVVVHGVAGERESYRPIRSTLTTSSDPIDLATAFEKRLGLREIYIADLDALERRSGPAFGLYRELGSRGFRMMVDAGVNAPSVGRELVRAGVSEVIVALETLRSSGQLESMSAELGLGRVIFSLDLKNGVALGGPSSWMNLEPLDIARRAIACGVGGLIVLDLAAVGSSAGCRLEELLRDVRVIASGTRLISGGGVRNEADLVRLASAGVDDVLVATALHSGAIGANTPL